MEVAAPSHQLPTELRTRRMGAGAALRVIASPGRVFARVEDTGAYGGLLAAMLVFVALIGFVEVKSGLIDRSVDQRTEVALATLEREQAHLVDRIELRDRMEDLRKSGEFTKLLARLGVVVLAPTYFLASFLIISAILYAIVALTGRKPEYHTLMTVCVFAGVVEWLSALVRLGMVLTYRTTFVDTSLGMLAPVGAPTLLSAVDPFRIWFWVLVGIGLTVTRQLGRRSAVLSCVCLATVAAAARAAMSYLP